MKLAFQVVFSLALLSSQSLAESTCFGTTSNGALTDACQLAAYGEIFQSYSELGNSLGRTFVHCKVAAVVEGAFASLHASHPGKVFVYGETGLRDGGKFEPHKTHQNGLSVDFMVPVLDERGKSVHLPTDASNMFGYDLEFDSVGRLGNLIIDYEAIVSHLAALKSAAAANGVGIWRVIFDPELQPMLQRSQGWSTISDLKFSERRSWVRHDEHYHVDFDIPCKPLPGGE